MQGKDVDEYVLPPAPRAAVPVLGGGRFPVRRIFCVARNYEAATG